MNPELRSLSNVELEQRRASTRSHCADLRAVLEASERVLEELNAEYVYRATGLPVGCQVYTDDALMDVALDQLYDVDLWDSVCIRTMAIRDLASENRPLSTVVRLYISKDEMLADIDIAATGFRAYNVRAENLTKVEETPK